MTKAIMILLGLSLAVAASADEKIQTREQLFAPITDPALNPERRYAELDLNGDGTNDLVLSESVSLGGTGGLVFNLYLGLGQDRFRQIDRFLAGVMSTETSGGTTRLWLYSHMSAGSGTIQYRYFDRKGIFQRSQYLMIYPGDGGSETGNGIYQAIFNDKTILKTETMGASNKAPEDTARKLADPQR
jgi:hypothetical protein